MTHAYVCDQCNVIFWTEPDAEDKVICHKCQSECHPLVRPSLSSDIGGAVRIAKDRYIDL